MSTPVRIGLLSSLDGQRQRVAGDLKPDPGKHREGPTSTRSPTGRGERLQENVTLASKLHRLPFLLERMNSKE
jgi:hypothetical protein